MDSIAALNVRTHTVQVPLNKQVKQPKGTPIIGDQNAVFLFCGCEDIFIESSDQFRANEETSEIEIRDEA
jgi:hypothetical protein